MSNKMNGVKTTPNLAEQAIDAPKAVEIKSDSVLVMPSHSVNERIEKHAYMKVLIDRYLTTKAKTEELKTFKLADDGSGFFLAISNTKGGQFVVNNQTTISAVVDLLIEQGEIFTAKSEQDVAAFKI